MKKCIIIVLIVFLVLLLLFILYKSYSYFNNLEIPNIVHFIFGFKEQIEEFSFVYYLAVYSCYIINKPAVINFYYHYKPYGPWWNKLIKIPNYFEYIHSINNNNYLILP